MQLSHTRPVTAARFDDPNLVSYAGLVPVMALAEQAGLLDLADEHLSVPTDKGAHPGRKIGSLVAGMVAGADSIADMNRVRHGAMGTIFDHPYAPSTLGSFLRTLTFGHVRQLDAVASRVLYPLAEHTPVVAGIATERMLVDIDDSIIEVHGYGKQGYGYGNSGVRGLNSLITTVSTTSSAPVITAQRLRRGACGSARGAARMVADTLSTLDRLRLAATPIDSAVPHHNSKPLLRADSAFYGYPTIGAAVCGGADVSVTVGLNATIKAAIATIADDGWTPIKYTNAVYDEESGRWFSVAEVAQIPFTAFASRARSHRISGCLIVRRIPDVRPKKQQGQGEVFDIWRFHAFTTTEAADLDTVAADKLHRHPRHHRASPRRSEELRTRAPAVGKDVGQCRLAGLRGDRVQPHPRCGDADRRSTIGQSHHRNHPRRLHLRTRPDRFFGPKTHPAPAHQMASRTILDDAVRQGITSTSVTDHLTTCTLPARNAKDPVKQPDNPGRTLTHGRHPPEGPQQNSHSNQQHIGASRLSPPPRRR